jgi:hypothetical protein
LRGRARGGLRIVRRAERARREILRGLRRDVDGRSNDGADEIARHPHAQASRREDSVAPAVQG